MLNWVAFQARNGFGFNSNGKSRIGKLGRKKRSKTGSSGASGVCIGIGIAIIKWLARWRRDLRRFTAKGYTDTAYDHLQGLVAGFLDMSSKSRGPYVSCTEEDVSQLREWMEANVPDLLVL